MTKPNAFDKAAQKARNKEQGIVDVTDQAEVIDEQALALAALRTDGIAVQTFDPARFIEKMKEGNSEAGERILEISEGMMFEGQLIGRGPDALVLDPDSGKTKPVGSWRMRLTTGARVSFLTAAQLERQLPEFVGRLGTTLIGCGGLVKTKKNRNMREFYIVGPGPDAPKFDGAVHGKPETATPVVVEAKQTADELKDEKK